MVSRRAAPAVVLGSLFTGVVFALAGLTPPTAAPVAAQPATPEARLSQCDGVITTTLSASTIQVCEEAEVVVQVEPYCPVCPNGINTVFVQIDKAFHAQWMDTEATRALDVMMRSDRRNEMKVAVVHYNQNQVRTRLRLTSNLAAARGPLNEPPYGHDPFGDVVGAAQEALQILREGRQGTRQGTPECEFIVFFASSKNIFPQMGTAMREAAQMIHRDRVTLFVGCPETHPDYCDFTREMPRTAREYTEAPQSNRLARMVTDFLRALDGKVGLRRLTMESAVPDGLEVVPGSFSRPPNETTELGYETRYAWNWVNLRTTAPQSVTFTVRPLVEGEFELKAALSLTDESGRSRTREMPVVALNVAGDCAPDTPTPTATATATDMPTATPTPTHTPTPLPKPIYLPISLKQECKTQWQHSDVVLVLDMSTSMNASTSPDSPSKLAAALAAAKLFVGQMDFTPNDRGGHDQVAIVGFNREAWIEAPLSSDLAGLRTAIDRLPDRQAQYTRLDLALEWGALALADEKRMVANTGVIVLLTDGLPNQVPYAEDGTMETTVLRAAEAAKAAGSVVYTIGLGAPGDINPDLLRAAASGEDLYFYAPEADDLEGIYSQIAYSFGCTKESLRWGQP